MTFIWVIMVQFASWMSMLDKGMAKKEAQRAKRERMSVYEHERRTAEEKKKYIQGEGE